MTLVSLTDCCSLLAIDPKTLRRWLSLSHLETQQSPHDARLKCLTHEQVQQLAAIHHRILETKAGLHVQPEISALPTSAGSRVSTTTSPDIQSDVGVAPLAMIMHILGQFMIRLIGFRLTRKRAMPPASSAHLPDLMKQLACLQTQVATLQDQLTWLNSQLQKQQQWRTSQAEDSKDFSQQSSQDNSLESPQDNSLESPQDNSRASSQDNSLESSQEMQATLPPAHTPSIDRRKHPHVLPLVEYGAQGKYVVVC